MPLRRGQRARIRRISGSIPLERPDNQIGSSAPNTCAPLHPPFAYNNVFASILVWLIMDLQADGENAAVRALSNYESCIRAGPTSYLSRTS